MATITLMLSDEVVERIASLIAERLEPFLKKFQQLPSPSPVIADDRLQLNRVEAAKRLGFSPMTLDRLVKRGLIHPNLATRRPMFPVKELERFISECSKTAVIEL